MRRRQLTTLSVAAAFLVACGGESRPTRGPVAEAGAGQWKTWVLPTPRDVPVAAPPDDTSYTRVSAAARGPAVEPWLQQTMTLVSRRPKDPVTASRNYALVAVAMYDAAVAASHWQERYGNDYPSTSAAIAGAGSRVIAYAYPEHPAEQLDQDAEQVARRSGAGGAAGLELGRRVAERVIDYARRDGADRDDEVRLPTFAGAWRPPPGSSAPPVAPLGGTWKTWVLRSGREVRPPPFPSPGSAGFIAEARKVLEVDRRLTAEQKRIAEFWAGGDGTELPPGRWLKVTLQYLKGQDPMSEVRVARIFALLTVAMADAGVAAWDAKYAYWVTRPENAIRDLGLDRDWKPYLRTPFFPAYVSGHAAFSGGAAEVLAHLFPQDAKRWRERAQEAAASRIYGGIHFPLDGSEGIKMGVAVGKRVVERATRDGATR